MSLDSPVASEPDSLGEKEPMEKLSEETSFVRGHINFSTFTRQRPTNLHRHQSRGHRQSLLSPHSVDNLDTDDANTPEFAMTQSMYEPYGKKEQIEKLTQQNKLMGLIASEKAAYAAQKRKQKEMKQKAIEQKKRNEERQKIVEERRIRMFAEEEEKRKKILNKAIKAYNSTSSYNGCMSQSIIVKNKQGLQSKFLDNRPLSSTGKVFGFGSSSPRYTCDPIKHERYNNPSLLDMSKESLPLSRMCASQIVSRYTQSEMKAQSSKNLTINISKSTANISDINKSRNTNGRGSISNVNGNPNYCNNSNKIARTTPKSIKISNLALKVDAPIKKPSDGHYRSRTLTKDVFTPTKPRSTTYERQIQSPNKLILPKNPVNNAKNQKTISKSDGNRLNVKNERALSAGNKKSASDHRPFSILASDGECEPNTGKRFEVRFVNAATISDKTDKENVISEDRKSIQKELTKEEYKERMTLKRKMAKEKKMREESEREIEKEKQLSENVMDSLTPVDTSITTESEISINILPKDKEISESQPELPVTLPKFNNKDKIADESNIPIDIITKEKELIETPFDQSKPQSVHIMEDNANEVTNNEKVIPTIKVSKGKEEMGASTDELDRLERKKRLESIMSRIKKTPSGSSENVSQHITTSVLQNMMDKGHLSGMSKTAAVLMRNANRSTELSSSISDIPSATENKSPTISIGNNSKKDINAVEDTIVSRGDCDGKEDSPKDIKPDMATKSNIMQNLSANTDGSYFTSWKEKYSISDSLDSENENTNG